VQVQTLVANGKDLDLSQALRFAADVQPLAISNKVIEEVQCLNLVNPNCFIVRVCVHIELLCCKPFDEVCFLIHVALLVYVCRC